VICALAGLVLVAGCSSGSGEGSSPSSNASAVCGKIVALPCSGYATIASCEAAVAESRQEAQEAGCSAEYENALGCTEASPPTCENGKLTTSQPCVADALAYAACAPSTICTSGSSNTSCTYKCGDTEMECQGEGSSWNCTCTLGPKSGQTFALNDNTDPCDKAPLESYCE
jgi:hypothetical protein